MHQVEMLRAALEEKTRMKSTKLLVLSMIALISTGVAFGQQESAYDFKISKAFMAELLNQNSIQFKATGKTIDHSGVHSLGSDCEMHIAADPTRIDFGSPDNFVVEPPNECEMPPAGTPGHITGTKLSKLWIKEIETTMFDGRDANGDLIGRECTFIGFPRIFTEHAQTSGENASNPDHVFEIHPLLAADCGSGNQLSWGPDTITSFPGMRQITPGSADACIRERTLEVKTDQQGDYTFREAGASGTGGRCGNFAVVEITTVDFLRTINGGHSAIARVTADGQNNATLKLYAFKGTDLDNWIVTNAGRVTADTRMYALGLFTYDYFQVKKLIDSHADLSQWTTINFPLAFILYGETETPPWQASSDGD